jgi:hypothetical protein
MVVVNALAGLLLRLEPQICEVLFDRDLETFSNDSENEYQPLTPPGSVSSGSRPLSPCHSTNDITKVTTLQSPFLDSGYRNSKSSLEGDCDALAHCLGSSADGSASSFSTKAYLSMSRFF